jgi:hypothetical protein
MTKTNLIIAIFIFLVPAALMAQRSSVTLSGTTKDKASDEALSFVSVVLKKSSDSTLVTGTMLNPGNTSLKYLLLAIVKI